MKKIFAIMLALMLALVAGLAVAEETAEQPFIDFDIKMDKLPEGYDYQIEENGGSLFAAFYKQDDPEAAIYYVSVAFSDEFEGFTLDRDLTEEEFENMKEILTEDYNDPTVEIRETEYGTKLICIAENDSQTDYADMITLWHGYFITVGIQKATNLVDEDMEVAAQIVSDMWIVEQE